MRRAGLLALLVVVAGGCGSSTRVITMVKTVTLAGPRGVLGNRDLAALRVYVSQADAVCTRYAQERPKQPKNKAEIQALFSKVVSVQSSQLDALDKLTVPTASSGTIHDWLTARRKVAAETRVLGDAFVHGDAKLLQVGSFTLQQDVQHADDIARQLGLEVCRDSKLVDLRTRLIPRNGRSAGGTTGTVPNSGIVPTEPGVTTPPP